MTLALLAAALIGDDSGKRDVQETRPAFVWASMPATDADGAQLYGIVSRGFGFRIPSIRRSAESARLW